MDSVFGWGSNQRCYHNLCCAVRSLYVVIPRVFCCEPMMLYFTRGLGLLLLYSEECELLLKLLWHDSSTHFPHTCRCVENTALCEILTLNVKTTTICDHSTLTRTPIYSPNWAIMHTEGGIQERRTSESQERCPSILFYH